MGMIMEYAAKVRKALEKIGTTNGTAPPVSQDPIDAVLHELMIADEMRAYANKRYDAAKAAMLKIAGDHGSDAVISNVQTMASKLSMKSSDIVMSGQHYTLLVSANAPVVSIDSTKFSTNLQAAGIDRTVIGKAQEGAKKKAAPATSYKVGEHA